MAKEKRFRKKKTHTSLVNTQAHAELAFRTLFESYKADTLTDGILLWLGKTDQLICLQMFLSLPKLMKENDFDDFLKGKLKMDADCDKQSVRIVGIAAALLSLITGCWELFGKEIHTNPTCSWPHSNYEDGSLGIIEEVLERLSLTDIQHELAASLLSIIGEKYYNLFLEKLSPLGNNASTSQMNEFQEDPELKEHMQLMSWYGLMRFFLDAVYFYFGHEK